jgi:hypothetical protein
MDWKYAHDFIFISLSDARRQTQDSSLATRKQHHSTNSNNGFQHNPKLVPWKH